MARFLRLLAVSAGSVFFAAAAASAQSHLLFGVETTNWQIKLDQTAGIPSGESKAHHSSSAFAVEWSYKNNFKARASLGTVASTLEEVDVSSDGAGGFLYMSIAAGLETRLESGGGLLLDLSYSFGRVTDPAEYNHDRTSFVAAYTFGDPETARFYTGIGYNTYNLEAKGMEFKEDERFSIVGGVRARSETFAGVIEGTLGLGEIGLRVAVMFGF